MLVRDIMIRDVSTVSAETTVAEIAQRLVSLRISGVPVVDAENRVLGVVTEGDLIGREEIDGGRKRSWLDFFASSDDLARQFTKTHALRAKDIMTREVITVGETEPVAAVAALIEKHGIKRVPVLSGGKLVGIVSRADLVRVLVQRAERATTQVAASDKAIAENFRQLLRQETWTRTGFVNFIVENGVLQLYGMVPSEDQHTALRVAAESIPGVVGVEDHVTKMPRSSA